MLARLCSQKQEHAKRELVYDTALPRLPAGEDESVIPGREDTTGDLEAEVARLADRKALEAKHLLTGVEGVTGEPG